MSGVPHVRSPAVERMSQIVFGQKHRLSVMVAIAQSDGLVNPTDLAVELGFPAQSAIQKPIKALTDAGLLTRHEGPGRVYYRRRDPHPIWEAAVKLFGQARAEELAVAESTN